MGDIASFDSVKAADKSRCLSKLPQIPRRRYLDQGFFEKEMESVFRHTWLSVGHVSEFDQPGSYLQVDLPVAPILIVRGRDEKLRAFLNSCRHRGATLVRQEQGIARSLTCQYHGWTYDLTGKLVGITDSETFPDLGPEEFSLDAVRCEQWGGFVFINLDKNAPPLLEWLAPIADRYSTIANAPLRVVKKQSYDLDCNWKIAYEAFIESYHANMVHRETVAQMIVGSNALFEMYPNGHGTMALPYSPNILELQWKGGTLRSELPRLPGSDSKSFQENAMVIGVFPNFNMGFQPSGFPQVIIWPVAIDRCRLGINWYGMDWGDKPRPAEWEAVIAAFDVLVEEDIRNLASIQKSVEAAPDRGVPLSSKECLLYQFHVELDKRIGVDQIPPSLRVPDVLHDFVTE